MTERLAAALRPRRVLVLASFDGCVWLLSVAVFAALRHDLAGTPVPAGGVLLIAGIAAVLQTGFGRIVRLHHGRAVLGSLEEMILLGLVTGTVGIVLTIANILIVEHPVPRTVPVAATFMTLALAAWGRAVARRVRELARGSSADTRPALILGAGEAGRQLVESMLRDPARTWKPVGLLDDDVLKRYRRFRGVQVLGTSEDLRSAVEATGAHCLVVAIPRAHASLIRRMRTRASDLGLDLKVLPRLAELPDGRVGISDLRDINVTDLLGRRQVDIDVASIAGYLTGKRVLVTGAGGSIGSELSRQIRRYGLAELIMLDHDSSALHATQLSLYGRAALDSPDVVLADIRDTEQIRQVFEMRRPQVVFHAAALKHVTMLEQYPCEAVKTNVWGTLSVLQAAKATGVRRFVNISTDKAANPCNVLGYSKRIAEGLTAAVATQSLGTFLSVRFGNVLGSRGSVLETFAAQIAAGGPLTVTDPNATRYFMTVEEAVHLVIEAAAIGHDGEALVLDMGEPVRIADIARQLIDVSGDSIDVVYTGLQPGEKLHEDLFGPDERDARSVHPLVSQVAVDPLDIAAARSVDAGAGPSAVIEELRSLARSPMRHPSLRRLA